MECVPTIVPYNPPSLNISSKVRRRDWKNIAIIAGTTIGFILLVAIIAAGVIISGGASAAATTAFVPATKQVVTFGAFVLTPL